MNWQENNEQNRPIVGIPCHVKTVFNDALDFGIWNGSEWVDEKGVWRGDAEEVKEWRYGSSNFDAIIKSGVTS